MRGAIAPAYFVSAAAWLLAPLPCFAQGLMISPARHELELRPGAQATFIINLVRDPRPEGAPPARPARMTVSPGDWDINRQADVDFFPAGSRPDTATPWTVFSPSEFHLPAGERQPVRVTVRVPKEAAPGEYRTGVFFEEHPLPVPGAAASQMMLRYRLSTLIYVIVPPVTRKVEIAELQLGTEPASASRPAHPILRALLRNTGTAHVRPRHWVEIRDSAGTVIHKTEEAAIFPVLPGREMQTKVPLPPEVLLSQEFEVKYYLDAGAPLPLLAASVRVGGQP